MTPDAYMVVKAKVDALEEMGKKKEARNELKAFLKKYPKSHRIEAAQGRLAQIL